MGLAVLFAATIAILFIEPALKSVVVKVMLFASYIASAAIFSLVAIDYGRTQGMTTAYIFACALLVGASIVYMLVSLSVGQHGPPPPRSQSETVEYQQHPPNFVPARPQYRSGVRRTLIAIKVARPRTHWKVPD